MQIGRMGRVGLAWGLMAAWALQGEGIQAQQARNAGRVTGVAIQEGTGSALVGAAVMAEGTALSSITDEDGRYVFPRVPAGPRTLTLTFIGHATQRTSVTVRAGETVVADFSVPISAVALEGLTVLGSRAMVQAEALTRQKNAANIVNVVASDFMGRFPDASAPEAVQRIPGITVARDQGEGRYIQIRGGSAANTQVTFNGVQIPSPEGDVRQIALDAVPVDILESIEVTKALLPDMDADAVGGSVNLATRSAPASRVLSLEASGGFAPLREEPSGSASLTYGDRTGEDGAFGYLLNGSWSRRSFGSDDVEPVYDFGDPGPGDDALEELEVRYYSLWRQRLGATASLDYRFDETSSLGFTGIYTDLTDNEQRRRLISVIEDGELEWQHKNREESLRSYSAALNGEHLLGGATLDYRGAWTRSEEDTPFDTEIGWLQEGVTFSPSIADPDAIRSNPSSLGGDYLFNEIEPASSQTEDTDLVGEVNLSIPFDLGTGHATVKFGGKIRDKAKTQDVVEEAFELASGDIALGGDYGEGFGESLRYPSDYALPAFGTSPDQVLEFIDTFQGQLDGEIDLESETEDYELDERVLAAYALAELNLSPAVLLLPGIRYEWTDVATSGFEFDSDTEELTPVSDTRDYGNVFPMVHARRAVTNQTNVRAAFTTSIQRPNFFDLVPYRVRDDEDLVLGNPDLEPMTARNFDLLVEHYDARIGVVSAGAFYKDLSDPLFIFIEENTAGGETEQPGNGTSGWIRGAEVALQRQLGGGIGVYGNYTFTDSEAELPTGRTAPLRGQADHVFNAAVSLERGGFSGQVSLNYNHEYVDEYADEASEDVYIDDHLQLDLSASYRVTPRSRVFLELVNLTNEPLVAYQGSEDRPIQMEYYRAWGRLGVRVAW